MCAHTHSTGATGHGYGQSATVQASARYQGRAPAHVGVDAHARRGWGARGRVWRRVRAAAAVARQKEHSKYQR